MDGLQQFSLCKTYGCIIHVIHECSTKNTKTRLDIHSKTSLQSQHNKAEKEKRRRDCLAKEHYFGREHTDVDIRNNTIFSFVVKLPSVIAHEQRWPLGTVLEMIADAAVEEQKKRMIRNRHVKNRCWWAAVLWCNDSISLCLRRLPKRTPASITLNRASFTLCVKTMGCGTTSSAKQCHSCNLL